MRCQNIGIMYINLLILQLILIQLYSKGNDVKPITIFWLNKLLKTWCSFYTAITMLNTFSILLFNLTSCRLSCDNFSSVFELAPLYCHAAIAFPIYISCSVVDYNLSTEWCFVMFFQAMHDILYHRHHIGKARLSTCFLELSL